MKLLLCDTDERMLEAWSFQFAEIPGVEVVPRSFLEVEADAILVANNAFGFLDSGLGLQVCESLGFELQDHLRETIRTEYRGELLVGQALVARVPGVDRTIVYTCAWRTEPGLEHTLGVFLAVRGALFAVADDADDADDAERRESDSSPIERLAAPGITGSGAVGEQPLDPRIAARQMRHAYQIARGLRGLGDKNLTQLQRRERKLKSVPGAGQG